MSNRACEDSSICNSILGEDSSICNSILGEDLSICNSILGEDSSIPLRPPSRSHMRALLRFPSKTTGTDDRFKGTDDRVTGTENKGADKTRRWQRDGAITVS